MSKTILGVTVAGVAVIVAVVFATSQGLLTDELSSRTADDGPTASSPSASGSPDAENGGSPGGDDGTGPDSEEGRLADTDEGAAPDTDKGKDDAETALEEEAKSYVEQLGEPSDEPMQMESATGFTSADQTVESREGHAGDSMSEDDSPEIGREVAELASQEAASDAPASESGDEVKRTQIEESEAPAVTAQAEAPEAELVAPTEASDAAEPDEKQAGPTEADAPRVDLPLTEQSPVTLADLIGPEETIPSDAVLYVHTVTSRDNEGIWGIVHEGILENFARGVAVHRGESTETYQVDIPEDADQRRPDNSSSFLGRLIHEKTRQSYVYNYRTDRVGRNPDLILPGEEIVIVSFTPEELVSVYKHFVNKARTDES